LINQVNKEVFLSFHKENFYSLCDEVAQKDTSLKLILDTHGYPPMWTRSNTFATLILFILEQQVSLASAKAAFNKLKQKIGRITPGNLLQLSDEEMRACYFSRQKTVYARHLAETMVSGKIRLKDYIHHHNDDIRTQLKQVKGIGDWTTDVYLLFVLNRTDIFPVGDLAMVNALKEIKKLNKNVSKDHILRIADKWKPYRSIATMLLWHYYLAVRNVKV
jgi:DNA-3-methyladenine glycosylase II